MSDDSKDDPINPEMIDATFRNGSLAVVGIAAGFSLNFVTRWAADPVPWAVSDLIGIIPMLIGIGLQVKALADFLSPSSLFMTKYLRAKNEFLVGFIATAVGVAIIILLDVLHLSSSQTIQ